MTSQFLTRVDGRQSGRRPSCTQDLFRWTAPEHLESTIGAAVRIVRAAAPPFPRHTASVPADPPNAPFVQVFGLDGDQGTRAAQRFFKERRIEISYVDLRRRPLAPAELRRFVDKLGAQALLNTESRAYKDAGMGYLRMDDAEVLERIAVNPALLRLPLVRFDTEVAVGRNESTWKGWVTRRDA
jgi:arsenate reductase-like glutaredoxin family protein